MRRIVISTIFFSHYLINGKIFGENNVFEHKMSLLILSTTFVRDISHPKETERDVMVNVQYTGLYAK